MESPGEYLKRERELRGIKLEEVAEKLCFSVSTVKALEEDNSAILPHPTYVKGFMRSYAKSLGLDDDELVLRYEAYLREKEEVNERKAKKEKEAVEPYAEKAGSEARPSRLPEVIDEIRLRFGVKSVAAIAAFFLAAIMVYFAVFGGKENKEEKPVSEVKTVEVPAITPTVEIKGKEAKAAPAAVASVPAPQKAAPAAPAVSADKAVKPSPANGEKTQKPAALATEGKAEKPVAPKGNEAEKPAPVAVITGGHTLEVTAEKITWLQLEIDGKAPFDIIMSEGKRMQWKAERVFFLTVGNAGGVKVVFDGKPLGTLGAPAEVVKVKLPAEGAR